MSDILLAIQIDGLAAAKLASSAKQTAQPFPANYGEDMREHRRGFYQGHDRALNDIRAALRDAIPDLDEKIADLAKNIGAITATPYKD